jgi:hypothetical protein
MVFKKLEEGFVKNMKKIPVYPEKKLIFLA